MTIHVSKFKITIRNMTTGQENVTSDLVASALSFGQMSEVPGDSGNL